MPDPARPITRRLARLIARYGQAVPLTHGGGGVTVSVSAKVSVLGNAAKFTYFRSGETAGWANPAYTLTIAGDYAVGTSGPAVGDTVELTPAAGTPLLYTVRKIDKPRIGGSVFKTVLYVARDSS